MNMYCTNCGNPVIINSNHRDGFIICPVCKSLNRVPAEFVDQFGDISIDGKSGRAFPKIWQAILLAVSIYVVLMIFFIPVAIIDMSVEAELIDNIYVEGLATLFSFALVLFIGFKRTRESFDQVFPLKNFNYSIIIPLLITVAGSTILLSDVDNLVRTFLPAPSWILQIFEELFQNPLKAILLAVIIAPVTEEFLCRGLILHGFLKNYNLNKAVFASAAVFMFMHLNPWQFAGAFFYGLLFAWLLVRTGSLWPCLIGHGFANFMPLLVANILGLKIPGFSEGLIYETVLQPWWFDLLGLVLALAGFFWLRKLFDNELMKRKAVSQTTIG